MTYRIEVYEPDAGEWQDTGEGPWETFEGARRFAETEVGMRWRIVAYPDHDTRGTPRGADR